MKSFFALAIGYMMTAGDGSSIANDQTGSKLQPMRFDWYTNGPAEQCSPNCHKWGLGQAIRLPATGKSTLIVSLTRSLQVSAWD